MFLHSWFSSDKPVRDRRTDRRARRVMWPIGGPHNKSSLPTGAYYLMRPTRPAEYESPALNDVCCINILNLPHGTLCTVYTLAVNYVHQQNFSVNAATVDNRQYLVPAEWHHLFSYSMWTSPSWSPSAVQRFFDETKSPDSLSSTAFLFRLTMSVVSMTTSSSSSSTSCKSSSSSVKHSNRHYSKTFYFRCTLILWFYNVEISLHFNLAFFLCSTSIYQAFSGQS